MLGLLLVLFVAVPAIELYVILQASHAFGILNTVAALIVISAVGAWLCRREGFSTLRKVQAALAAGRIPTRELQDGALILFAGALLLMAPRLPWLGRLPGDFVVRRGPVTFYFPLATSLVVSVVVSLLAAWFWRR